MFTWCALPRLRVRAPLVSLLAMRCLVCLATRSPLTRRLLLEGGAVITVIHGDTAAAAGGGGRSVHPFLLQRTQPGLMRPVAPVAVAKLRIAWDVLRRYFQFKPWHWMTFQRCWRI